MPPQPPHFGTRDRDKTKTGHRVKPVTISSFSEICFFLQNCYGLLSISFDSVPPFQYRRGNVIGFAMNDIISIRAEIFKKTALLSLKLTSLSSSVGYSSFKILWHSYSFAICRKIETRENDYFGRIDEKWTLGGLKSHTRYAGKRFQPIQRPFSVDFVALFGKTFQIDL